MRGRSSSSVERIDLRDGRLSAAAMAVTPGLSCRQQRMVTSGVTRRKPLHRCRKGFIKLLTYFVGPPYDPQLTPGAVRSLAGASTASR
jgi:hypothetical protein